MAAEEQGGLIKKAERQMVRGDVKGRSEIGIYKGQSKRRVKHIREAGKLITRVKRQKVRLKRQERMLNS